MFALAWCRGPISGRLEQTVSMLKAIGPYAVIELLLPGGTLLVLMLWLYRRYRPEFENFRRACTAPSGRARILARLIAWPRYATFSKARGPEGLCCCCSSSVS
jgi:hypothetical protein